MKTPKVSVVLTTYNQGRWLAAAVDSVVGQTYPHWELLLIDNGSTDETKSILDRYRAEPRITITEYPHNEKHTVISNRAIATATGEYIAFLYGDDYFLPRKLERQLERFAELPASVGVVYCDSYRLIEETQSLTQPPYRPCRGRILEELIFEHPFVPIAPLLRRECCVRYPFNEDVFMEGEGLFTKVGMTYAFDCISERLCVMREHASNMGKEIEPSLRRNKILFEALFSHDEFPRDKLFLRAAALAWLHRMKGWQAIRTTRRFDQGRAWLIDAVRYQPSSLLNLRVLLGLSLSVLPRAASNRVLNVANRLFGTPPAPPEFSGI